MLVTTGTLDFQVGDETFNTWYKVVGDLKSGVTPLVTLHGGPGSSHDYLVSHTELYTTHGIPIIFYDQLGIGLSTHLRDKPTEFWTVELFKDELANVLEKLGIENNFDLLGQSWGAMLAADYASSRHPKGLRRLILANGPPSQELWDQSMLGHLSKFPQDFQDLVLKHEREGTTSSQEYKDAMMEFSRKHSCQVSPYPEEYLSAFKAIEDDPTVSTAMSGTCAFECKGNLKPWSVVDRLHTITCPTLVCNGVQDCAQDFVVAPFVEKIPKVKWVKFAGSHAPMWEDKKHYFETIGGFLTAQGSSCV